MNIKILETGAWDYNNDSHDEVGNFDQKLADYLTSFIKTHNIKNVFDFGCSTGYYLKYISERTSDIKLTGVEPNVNKREDNHFENILNYDLAKSFDIGNKGSIICLEVLEHIPSQFESVVIENIKKHCDGYLFMSWATPGQGGYGHYNERSFDYVYDLFTENGFEFMEEETKICRDSAYIGWLKNNCCIFKKI